MVEGHLVPGFYQFQCIPWLCLLEGIEQPFIQDDQLLFPELFHVVLVGSVGLDHGDFHHDIWIPPTLQKTVPPIFNVDICLLIQLTDGGQRYLTAPQRLSNILYTSDRYSSSSLSVSYTLPRTNSLTSSLITITINLDRKAGQPVRLSFHLVPKLQ